MVEAARTAIRYDCRLRAFYERVRRRRRTIFYGAGGGIRTHAARGGHRLFVYLVSRLKLRFSAGSAPYLVSRLFYEALGDPGFPFFYSNLLDSGSFLIFHQLTE